MCPPRPSRRTLGLLRPKKAAPLGVVMRERPAFRSAFAKHALNGGCGIVLTGRRHKALLGRPAAIWRCERPSFSLAAVSITSGRSSATLLPPSHFGRPSWRPQSASMNADQLQDGRTSTRHNIEPHRRTSACRRLPLDAPCRESRNGALYQADSASSGATASGLRARTKPGLNAAAERCSDLITGSASPLRCSATRSFSAAWLNTDLTATHILNLRIARPRIGKKANKIRGCESKAAGRTVTVSSPVRKFKPKRKTPRPGA